MALQVDFEQQCRDKMTVIFLAEIMNRLGVVDAGKVFQNVVKKVEKEEDESSRLKMQGFIRNVREGYLNN
ncbi:hypothetical protein [Erwinia sp. QL-Z3]|uniref:hypothetical protein n=1 Tax=Erwinia sp. QL-Z3 TaxID=2547962 RepID=UPI0010709D77|nr:hypothetical protein [Erwinia sp. QL-Z3]QBR49709.1 hypothetical protein E2F51_06755 [Erwinia sp. QL-Z3]